jgi:hypothetical protein
MVRVIQEIEPICFEQAIGNPKWENAMDEKMATLDVNATWELVALLKNKKAIGCKWVYKIKHNVDGYVNKYKARLVARGYAQTYGIDYEETYSLVTKMTTIKVIIVMATTKGWSLHQMDVKNVILHGDLQKEMYMEQPPSYVDQTHLIWFVKTYSLVRQDRLISCHKWISNIQCRFFTICEKDKSWDCSHSHLC